ncbi:hypothetical protein VU01_12622 [Candidatus Electrothrix marina]|uniref:Uncharacterized protein n=1 Tax=Candidatus Electrothrix marina TaxID=1859130 RepID=A0A444JCS2_9BACT|nr:hypothetical protein VU01_12622 [Candidatus Electrothrix marina]
MAQSKLINRRFAIVLPQYGTYERMLQPVVISSATSQSPPAVPTCMKKGAPTQNIFFFAAGQTS